MSASETHQHDFQGQSLVHAHEGGDKPHGYFDHPEDGVAEADRQRETAERAHALDMVRRSQDATSW